MIGTEIHSQKKRVFAISVSIAASVVIFGLKLVAYFITHSPTLLSDALESIVNIGSSALAFMAIVVASRPADEGHPFGHGKIEYFSAIFEGTLICLASLSIIYKAGGALFDPQPIVHLGQGLMWNGIGGVLNGILGWYLLRTGRREKSKSLLASAHHILSDFYTTIGIVVGLTVVYFTQILWLDPLIAIGLALWILRTGFHIIHEASHALLDGQDVESIHRIVKTFNQLAMVDVITLHNLRSLPSGRNRNVSLHVSVPEYYEVLHAHDVVEAFTLEITKRVGLKGEFITHMDPCHRRYCTRCRVAECPIRQAPFAGSFTLTYEEAIQDEDKDHKPITNLV